MKKVKRAYYYLFYKLYKFSEGAPSRWMSEMKAGIVIIVLEIWIYISLMSYFSVITKRATELTISSPIVFLPLIIILVLNYFAFVHTNVWKEYVKEFDRLPKRTNRIYGWIVFIIVVLILANLIFSFYLMSQVDWSQYRK